MVIVEMELVWLQSNVDFEQCISYSMVLSYPRTNLATFEFRLEYDYCLSCIH